MSRLALREEDIIRISLEFLNNRELHISQLSLERETGVINGVYSDDVLFLRQLILDGQWDDVVEFIQPLEALTSFDMRFFKYTILRHKYIELLCIKSEAGGITVGSSSFVEGAVEEVVEVLKLLEKLAPSKEEYSGLCLLLTLPRLADHSQYKDWNPSKARVQCFKEVFPLVEKFLPGDKKLSNQASASAKNDRLIQLVIKGLLYESCVNYCQAKATGGGVATVTNGGTPNGSQNGIASDVKNEISFCKVLDSNNGFTDSDLSLLSWLQSIPTDIFSVPFEQKTLNVDVERLEKPSLETSWTEHMLITPIKPKTFPHSVMPFTRPRSAADIMTRSLMPSYDAGASVLIDAKQRGEEAFGMSRSSFASFHLTGIKPSSGKMMTSSVDRLFESDSDVFLSNNFNENSRVIESQLKQIDELFRINENSESVVKVIDIKKDKNCDVHGLSRRGSTDSCKSTVIRRGSTASNVDVTKRNSICGTDSLNKNAALRKRNRNSISSITDLVHRSVTPNGRSESIDRELFNRPRRDSAPIIHENSRTKRNVLDTWNSRLFKGMEHPSNFPSMLRSSTSTLNIVQSNDANRPRFVAVTSLEDVQAVRCAEFHPNGSVYAIGSNSKTFRICEYPTLSEIRDEHSTYQATVLFKRTKHHKGSIYCMAWSPQGDLIATGSNDKTVKLMRYNDDQKQLEGREIELTMHDGTVRDLCFLEDSSNKSSLLISGGAGDCKIYITDCATSTPYQALSGHGNHILSLYNWGGAMFVSGSQDKTVRFWDLRTRGCVNMVTPATNPNSRQGSPVAGVCVDPSGRLLVSGHEDSSCVLYDIRGNRPIQCFKPHSSDIRSVRFSPSAYYLLSASYDNKLVLTDLQGDLTMPLPSVVVAQHSDKVISGRWHPSDFSFLSTSADKTAKLWALPPV
ncbi:unnamed protein product [Diamesa hyperborea]